MTQVEAFAILKTGRNVFLTGEPGSGKTHTVNEYISYLRSCGIEPAITASTGIAATHLNGLTIHSWSGIGIKRDLTKYDLDRIKKNARTRRRIKFARILIIDEVSMLSAHTLSMVEVVTREIREIQLPFGGLQVVLVGDFFQLPPVAREEAGNAWIAFEDAAASPEKQFAYHSPVWDASDFAVCYLSEQHRQEDPQFLEILSAIRLGEVAEEHVEQLHTRWIHDPETTITKLFPHNADVHRVNEAELAKLPGNERTFFMEAIGPRHLRDQLKKSCLSPETLALKISARVMFTRNNAEEKFVNGTTGEVIGFSNETSFPIIRTKNGREIEAAPMTWSIEIDGMTLAAISQIPLRLAWAITVHKSQGMSLDAAVIDLRSAFEYGQGYVALSRLRTLEGLHLVGWSPQAVLIHPDVILKDSEFRNASEDVCTVLQSMTSQELAEAHAKFIQVSGGHAPDHEEAATAKQPKLARTMKTTSKQERWRETLELIQTGKSIAEAASIRGKREETIMEHLEGLKSAGKFDPEDVFHLTRGNEATLEEIQKIFQTLDTRRLKPVFEHFDGAIPYATIRLARLFLREQV